MGLLQNLSVLALRQLIDGVCEAAGIKGASGIIEFLQERFKDQSERLTTALHKANEKAWKALEVALAGESLLSRLWNRVAHGEDSSLPQKIRAFLDVGTPEEARADVAGFRQQCLHELRKAHAQKLFTEGSLDPRQLAQQLGGFAQFAEPRKLLGVEWQTLSDCAEELRQAGYPNLARLLSVRTPEQLPLLVIAVRYYFRRAVEEDQKLFQGLSWATWQDLAESQKDGFAALELLLTEMNVYVVQTHGAVLEIKEEMQGQREEIRKLAQAVLQLLEQHHLQRRELVPHDSLSIRNEDERRLVKELVSRYRELPEAQRRQLPAMLNGLGKLQVVAGDFDAAQRDFQELAALVDDPQAKAEAHYNAYRTALESRAWSQALNELRQAILLDAKRWSPFPVDRYEPQRILGAGGFGVAFLCKDGNLDDLVVVKALLTGDLDRGIADVFTEGQALRRLNHSSIIRLWDCGYADAVNRSRPFLVMEYFDGLTLEEYVTRHGPLLPADLLPVAQSVAEGLHAAHARGIWHRDVKPANLLVRRTEEKKRESAWEVKLIDFGLALKQSVIEATVSRPVARTCVMGYSVAGTLDYAAPEQLGKLEGVAVGPYSDVYSFGKTLCYALFKTVQPLRKHWHGVPEPFADLLEQCFEEKPRDRPKHFAEVLQRLAAIRGEDKGRGTGDEKSTTPIFTNSIGMKLALIPAGNLQMGASETEKRAKEDEKPQHVVTITKPFHLGIFPVTVGSFRTFTHAAEYRTEAEVDGKGAHAWTGKEWKLHPQVNWRNPGWTQTNEEPVVCVSWNDAKAFCDWLSLEEGRTYRLPTEAEWEYACRAGTTTPFYFGDSLSSLQANFNGIYPYGAAANGPYLKKTSKVGSYAPNGFGLYDMHGNVWEWCQDWYDKSYYKESCDKDPQGGSEGTLRVLRGGSWQDAGKDCRAAWRGSSAPSFRGVRLGFRVVCVLA